MKKFVTLLSFLIVATAIFAQKGKVSSALSLKESGEIQKAYKTIEEALDPLNEKSVSTINWPKTWEVKGQILHEMYKKEISDIVEEPLFAAYDSYIKAIELDSTNKSSKSIKSGLLLIQFELPNYAVKCYEKERFDASLKCFETLMAINQLSIMKPTSGQAALDTAVFYNAGLTAFKAKNWDKSIEYFNVAAKNDYNGASCYNFVYQSYQAKGDTLNSLKALKEGHQNYPNDEVLLIEIINFYINKGRSDEALKYIDLAIAEKPENATLYTAKGAMLEKLGNIEGAIELYKKSAAIDSTQFTPYYNLSVIYFNRGVEVINSANQIPPNQTDKYDAEIEKAKEHFKISLPFIEKAYSIDSTEIAILESLKTVYYRLQMNDKYLEVNKKIQSLKK